MGEKRKVAAFVYDFDGTLAKGNIQEHSFIPQLDLDKAAFWADVKKFARENDADEILTYMWRMLERAREKSIRITSEALREHGAKTPLFEGVGSWFDRMNAYAESLNLDLEHYVVSSGIFEMIKGCPVFGRFKWVPVKTVKTRHTRALAELRARLDERAGGDRSRWVSALLVLRVPRIVSGRTALVTKAAVVAGALGFAAWFLLPREPEPEPELAAHAPVGNEEARVALEPVNARRSAIPVPAASAPLAAPAPATAGATLFGRVVDLGGTPVPHARVDARLSERELVLLNLGGGRSTIRAKSADNPNSLLGEGLDWLIVDEAARLKPEAWQAHLSQRLIDKKGWALLISTPRGKGWFYDMFRRGQDKNDKEHESWNLPSWSNPTLDRELIEQEREKLPERVFRQEYGGEFIEGEGAVFRYIRERATGNFQPPEADTTYYAGLDLGRLPQPCSPGQRRLNSELPEREASSDDPCGQGAG